MRMLSSLSLVLALHTVSINSASADSLDDKIQAEMKRQSIPGLSLVVVQDGKIVREQGYGLANIEHQVPVKPETIFQSGSVGKPFTAALVMLLDEDGKLALTDPISKHLNKTPAAWQDITIQHLLNHTSGLGDPYEKLDLRKDYSDAELMKLAGKMPMLFQPGEKWDYSNIGYLLLGFICNKAGGKFYGDQLRERIFEPLDMSTRIINEREIVMHRAAGYDVVKREWKNQEWVSPTLNTTADGSLYLTARDLAKWDIALYSNKLLSEAIKKASWTPVPLKDGTTPPYGYGWQISQVNGHPTIEHGGAWQGFTTQISRYVDDHLGVIVLTNRSRSNPKKIADFVAAEYVPALKREPMKAIEDPEPAFTQSLHKLVLQIIDGAVTKELFSAKLVAALFPERIKEGTAELATFGNVQTLELLSREMKGEQKQLRYRLTFQHEVFLLSVVLDKAGKIDGIAFRLE